MKSANESEILLYSRLVFYQFNESDILIHNTVTSSYQFNEVPPTEKHAT